MIKKPILKYTLEVYGTDIASVKRTVLAAVSRPLSYLGDNDYVVFEDTTAYSYDLNTVKDDDWFLTQEYVKDFN